jgi:hypothetical protein
VVFGQQFLLKHELEAVGKEGGDKQNVSDDLQALHKRKDTGSVPDELAEEKMRLDAPTMRTPTRASALPAT